MSDHRCWDLEKIIHTQSVRLEAFPVARDRIFLGHAGVSALPREVVTCIQDEAELGSRDMQEAGDFMVKLRHAREVCAALVNAKPDEIAMLGPTSLGLSLVAAGLDWQAGDEVIYYPDDYPANVYPWIDLQRRGVKPVGLHPATPGKITPELVRDHLTPKTRLVALSSCHFLTGYRLDYRAVGELLQARGVLFCLDAIQSLGATPIDAAHVDFLSADSHKWMLGPLGAGMVYVKESRFDLLRPVLLGAWNVLSPHYVAQETIRFESGARRYEPGALNWLGTLGMVRALELILSIGIPSIEKRLLHLRAFAEEKLRRHGMDICHAETGPEEQSGIITTPLGSRDPRSLSKRLEEAKITLSIRHDRQNQAYARLSPHFYNTEDEIAQAVEALAEPVGACQ